jgi:hypothetical protein
MYFLLIISGQHFAWYALRSDVLHQAAQVVADQVQEVGLHAQEVRLRGDRHILEEEAEKKISEVCAVENKK